MRRGDLDSVAALAVLLPTAPQWPLTAYEDALDATSHPRRVSLVAATSAGAITGFAIAAVLLPEAELESIAVAPEQQRQGTGNALLRAILSECASVGCTGMLLEVRASNAAAQRLYVAAGFEPCGRRPGYYAFPAEDALVFRRSLRTAEK